MVRVLRGPAAGPGRRQFGRRAAGDFPGRSRVEHRLRARDWGSRREFLASRWTWRRTRRRPRGWFPGPAELVGTPTRHFFLKAGQAKQIVEWNRTHRFCGRCGAETEFGSESLAKKCPRCGMIFYPRLSPAAIVLIRHGDRVLLARSPGFPPGMYSVLAGFVEPGESIEETIRSGDTRGGRGRGYEHAVLREPAVAFSELAR